LKCNEVIGETIFFVGYSVVFIGLKFAGKDTFRKHILYILLNHPPQLARAKFGTVPLIGQETAGCFCRLKHDVSLAKPLKVRSISGANCSSLNTVSARRRRVA